MSAPWFNMPGTYAPLSERRLRCAQEAFYHFVIDVSPAFCVQPGAEGWYAFAQCSPTCIACIRQDNIPSVNNAHGHALLEPLWVFPRSQSCHTGLAHLDTKASVELAVSASPERVSYGADLAVVLAMQRT